MIDVQYYEEQLRATAKSLLRLADGLATGAIPLPEAGLVNLAQPAQSSLQIEALRGWAKAEYANRRKRERYFPSDVFGEPAWDLLLDLYVANAKGERVNISNACLGASVPVSTGLRWIALLEGAGLLERYPSPDDQRVTYVRPTRAALDAMERYLADVTKPASFILTSAR
jgi:hypothetical protein